MRLALLGALPEVSESGVDLTRYVLVCTGTILAVLLCAWLLRRYVATGLQRRALQRSLAVVDVLPLGKRQRAVVVRCYDRNFLIGLGEKEVSLLAELDLEDGQVQVRPVPPPAEAAETAVPAAPELPQNFAEVLAEEVPLRQATVKPEGPQRMPKEGLLG